MTIDPTIRPGPTPADDAAIKIVGAYATTELHRTQTRGEKWLAGVTALIGIVTSALVVKGKESFAKLNPSYEVFGLERAPRPLWWVIACLALAIAAFVYAIFHAYGAAFGNPLEADELDQLDAEFQETQAGAATALRNAIAIKIAMSRDSLKDAINFTILGIVLTICALTLTWLVPDTGSIPDSLCLDVTAGDATVTLEFKGALPPIVGGEYTVRPCG